MALIIWAAFAFVTWNVVFDRQVYLAGVRFTEQQIERQQRGEAVASIDAAFEPGLGSAVLWASVWGGAVLVAGVALTALVSRRTGAQGDQRDQGDKPSSPISRISL